MSPANWFWFPPTSSQPRVSLRNDTYQLTYNYLPATDQVERVMNLVGAKRITEARRFGLPLEWSDMLTVSQANQQIEQLLVEARQLNHGSAAFYVVWEG
jgi:hypothetical protein